MLIRTGKFRFGAVASVLPGIQYAVLLSWQFQIANGL